MTYDLPFKTNDYYINKDGHIRSPSTTRPETNKHKVTGHISDVDEPEED